MKGKKKGGGIDEDGKAIDRVVERKGVVQWP